MPVKIAVFNFENMFSRPAAMELSAREGESGNRGSQAIDDHAELNRIIAKENYSATDKERLLALDERYGFSAAQAPRGALVFLQKIRGQLFSRAGGSRSVVASSRADWVGWFELARADVKWTATMNTGRVIAAVDPDILICVEVENRIALKYFNEQVLAATEIGAEFAAFRHAFPPVMVIDGNDPRGIDVGLMSRYPINAIRSHIDDRMTAGSAPTLADERLFSRDCPEYLIEIGSGQRLMIMPNHFKSKRSSNRRELEASQAKRRLQAIRAHEIARDAAAAVTPLVLIGGDLNDTPDSDAIAPLWAEGFVDIQDHPSYPTDRPGTTARGRRRASSTT